MMIIEVREVIVFEFCLSRLSMNQLTGTYLDDSCEPSLQELTIVSILLRESLIDDRLLALIKYWLLGGTLDYQSPCLNLAFSDKYLYLANKLL